MSNRLMDQMSDKTKRYNIIIVLDKDMQYTLLCLKTKKIYVGLYNFVGGHIEPGETDLESAYRELFEETGITDRDIELKPLSSFYYAASDIELVAYAGRLKNDVELVEEENPLSWFPLDTDFFGSQFAGEGNTGHLLAQVMIHKNKLFGLI